MNNYNTGTGTALDKLSKDFLLQNVDQCQIWSDLLQRFIHINSFSGRSDTFCNPWRRDSHPGCFLYVHKGQLRLSDYADTRFHRMSFFDAWMHVYKVTFTQAMFQIARLYLGEIHTNQSKLRTLPIVEDFSFDIYYKLRAWKKADKEYWSQYDISRAQLESERIFPINYLAFNTKENPNLLSVFDVNFKAYAIKIADRLKVYMPGRKPKTIHNVRSTDIGGYSKIDTSDNIFFFNKAAKDHMVMVNQGYNSRYLMNEGCKPSVEYANKLAEQFEYVFIFLDNDEAGLRESVNVSQYCNHATGTEKFIPLNLPVHLKEQGIKDISDYQAYFGNSNIINTLVDEKQFSLAS